jgi:subtilisin family serine protease
MYANQTTGLKGVAPGATYISSSTGGNDDDFQLIDAADNAVGVAPDVINFSVAQETSSGQAALKEWLDYISSELRFSVTASAGNIQNQFDCQPNFPYVRSPGMAFNALTVGGIGDNSTGNVWTDNYKDTETCYKDQYHETFKPEIAAPSICVQDTGSCWTGTSFAAPQAAGAVALISSQDPTEIRTQPELAKAVIIAGSRLHRVYTSSTYSDWEGAGDLDTRWANKIVNRATYGGTPVGNFGYYNFNATWNGSCYIAPTYKNIYVDTVPGRPFTFVISWASHGFSSSGPDLRLSDIDLHLYDVGGNEIASSIKVFNTVEIIDWTAHSGEMPYRVKIFPYPSGWNCELPTERVGWAWAAFP